jgi:protein SCO1/2
MMPRRRVNAALLCGAVSGAGAAPWRTAHAANWLPTPAVPDVPLLDHEGRSRRLPELLRGRAVVVNFFFTGCATVCSPQTALLREAARQWQARPGLRDVLVVSISVDPLGDGPAQLRDYARRFGLPVSLSSGTTAEASTIPAPSWVLLTGDVAPLRSILAAFDVPLGAPDQHPAVLWLGDSARGRWTRTSALNAPALTTRLLEELRA